MSNTYVIITHRLLSGRTAEVFYMGSGDAQRAHSIHFPKLIIVSVETVSQAEYEQRNAARIAATLAR